MLSRTGVIDVYKKVSEDNQVAIDASLGQMEGEVNEHSIRKIMECLIQDFVMANGNEENLKDSLFEESIYLNLVKTVVDD